MKRLLIIFLLFYAAKLQAQSLVPVDESSLVSFSIKNLGINTTGSFKGLKGTIHYNPQHVSGASFVVSVDANTIDTEIQARDAHLKKADYFHTEKYPLLRFTSTSITQVANSGTMILHGQLTIKGVTKELSFPFTAQTLEAGYLFKGSFKINRRDFNIGGSSITLSDNLVVNLSVLARKY